MKNDIGNEIIREEDRRAASYMNNIYDSFTTREIDYGEVGSRTYVDSSAYIHNLEADDLEAVLNMTMFSIDILEKYKEKTNDTKYDSALTNLQDAYLSFK